MFVLYAQASEIDIARSIVECGFVFDIEWFCVDSTFRRGSCVLVFRTDVSGERNSTTNGSLKKYSTHSHIVNHTHPFDRTTRHADITDNPFRRCGELEDR